MSNLIRFEDNNRLAKAFKESGMFPDLKSEAQAIVKIQAGAELGIEPFTSMQGIDIVQGKPRMTSGLQAALIKRSGRYNFKILEHTEKVCRLEFYEKWGEQWQIIGQSEYAIQEAQAAGLATKDVWKKHPKNMLFARAVSNGAKWFCADVFVMGAYNESDEFDYAPVVGVDNSGIEVLKTGGVIDCALSPPAQPSAITCTPDLKATSAALKPLTTSGVAQITELEKATAMAPTMSPESEALDDNCNEIEGMKIALNECKTPEELEAVARAIREYGELPGNSRKELLNLFKKKERELSEESKGTQQGNSEIINKSENEEGKGK